MEEKDPKKLLQEIIAKLESGEAEVIMGSSLKSNNLAKDMELLVKRKELKAIEEVLEHELKHVATYDFEEIAKDPKKMKHALKICNLRDEEASCKSVIQVILFDEMAEQITDMAEEIVKIKERLDNIEVVSEAEQIINGEETEDDNSSTSKTDSK